MSWRSSVKEQRNVSADANEKPMKALFHPRVNSNIRPGDHASPHLGPAFIIPSQNEVALDCDERLLAGNPPPV
jgi:hypothetical protein